MHESRGAKMNKSRKWIKVIRSQSSLSFMRMGHDFELGQRWREKKCYMGVQFPYTSEKDDFRNIQLLQAQDSRERILLTKLSDSE